MSELFAEGHLGTKFKAPRKSGRFPPPPPGPGKILKTCSWSTAPRPPGIRRFFFIFCPHQGEPPGSAFGVVPFVFSKCPSELAIHVVRVSLRQASPPWVVLFNWASPIPPIPPKPKTIFGGCFVGIVLLSYLFLSLLGAERSYDLAVSIELRHPVLSQFERSWLILGPKNSRSGPLWDHLGAILRSIWLALMRSAVI
jgi:hypothetical protein